MEYQNIANLLDNEVALNASHKFRTRNWVEINDKSRGTYTTSNDIKLKDLIYVIMQMHTCL